MSLFGKLFGSDKAVSSLIEHASAGLDKMIHTDEEKSEQAAEDRSEARKMVVKWLENTQGQNLARRLLALLIAVVWLLQYVSAQVLAICAVWVGPEASDRLDASVRVLSANADQMSGAMMLLLSFYFAAPHMSKIVDVAMLKFGGSGKNK